MPSKPSLPNLREFHRSLRGVRPPLLSDCRERLERERGHLLDLLSRGVPVYGASTLTGHRHHVEVEDGLDLNQEILRTHAIGGPPHCPAHEARCIGLAKLFAWAAGRSGVSWSCFQAVADLLASPSFRPSIPARASQSCGDVIPAAHWAQAVQDGLLAQGRDGFAPGEVMAAINGSFVQVGRAASLLPALEFVWSAFAGLSARMHVLCRADAWAAAPDSAAGAYAPAALRRCRALIGAAPPPSGQSPVSLRALPQVLEAVGRALEEFEIEVDRLLGLPSGNPLFNAGVERPLSQASFLAPVLAMRAGALLEAVLFAMAAQCGRAHHLLSGEVAGVPVDAAARRDSLGLIQYPKLMSAVLEQARLDLGRRTFASGSATSYGAEDLPTHGMEAMRHLSLACAAWSRLCELEWRVVRHVAAHCGPPPLPADDGEDVEALLLGLRRCREGRFGSGSGLRRLVPPDLRLGFSD